MGLSFAVRCSVIIFLVSIFTQDFMHAQTFSGEYYLTSVPEMAAGFKFTTDGMFAFYYVYGSVDRTAQGTFTVDGNTIRLQSDKKPGKDFDIMKESRKGSGVTIHIINENPILASNVRCLYFVDDEQHEAFADEKGSIHIDSPNCGKVYLQHGIFPDIATLIRDENNKNNDFEIALNADIQKVSFKGIDFVIGDNTLTCLPNYFMPMDHIVFEKSGN